MYHKCLRKRRIYGTFFMSDTSVDMWRESHMLLMFHNSAFRQSFRTVIIEEGECL